MTNRNQKRNNNNNNIRPKRKISKRNPMKIKKFVTTKQPRMGKLAPSYRQFLNTRKQRMNAAIKRGGPRSLSKMIHPYIQCRLNPFIPSGGIGIPDDTDAQRLVVDHRQITSFKVGNTGTFNIVIAPSIPQILWFNTLTNDTTYTVNGDHPTVHNGNYTVFHPICLPQYRTLPLTRFDELGQYNQFKVYLDAMRARIVTIAFRIIYTGSTMNNSGSIMVNKLGFSVQESVPNMNVFTVLNGHGGTDMNYNNGQVLVRRTDLSTNSFDIVVNDTVRCPLRQGVQGLLKHASGTYKWCPVTDNETYMTVGINDRISLLTQGLDPGAPDQMSQWPSLSFIDDQWSPAAIAIRGATEGQTFDIETVYCVEYIPNLESEASSLSKQPPAPNNKAVEVAAAQSKEAPLAGAPGIFQTLVKSAPVVASMLMA